MIIFVDDEPRRMATYVDELELSYDVKFIDNVDDAITYFEQHQQQVELIILDMMMPSGVFSGVFNDYETQFGMRTGIALYEKIRQTNKKLPIIILTNLSLKVEKDQDIIPELARDKHCKFIKKEEAFAQKIVTEVKRLLNYANY